MSEYIDYYYDTGVPAPQPVSPTPPDEGGGTGIAVSLAPKLNVGSGRSVTQQQLQAGTKSISGSGKGGRQQFFKSYINFDTNKYTGATFDYKKQISEVQDASGPFKSNKLEKTLGTSATGLGLIAGSLSAAATGGLMSSILTSKGGVKNPITGKPTGRLIPLLDDAIMKRMYDAVDAIRNNSNPLLGDAFRLGAYTFARKPNSYYFEGNLSAVGMDHADLHRISALARGIDPNDYNWKTGKARTSDEEGRIGDLGLSTTGTGHKVLTYGSGLSGGYRLDGFHVDSRGRLAGSGVGASAEFADMAYKTFNGDAIVAKYGEEEGLKLINQIAQEWREGTSNFRNFSGTGYTAKEKTGMANWFNIQKDKAMALTTEESDSSAAPTSVDYRIDPVGGSFSPDQRIDPVGGSFSPDQRIDPVGGSFSPDNVTREIAGSFSPDQYVGGVDSSVFDDVRNRYNTNNYTGGYTGAVTTVTDQVSGQNMMGSQIINEIFPNSTPDDKGDNTGKGTKIGSDFQKKDDEEFEKTRDDTDTGFGGDYGFKEGGQVGTRSEGDIFANPQLYMQNGGEARLVGGVSPTEVPEGATVADDQNRTVAEGSVVMNAPSVEEIILNPDAINVAGVRDVRKMVMDAYTFAKQQGLSVGNVDRNLYERSVDVALSKGELVVPPDLVRVIGKDRLLKINNRGKKEVDRRAKKSNQPSRPNGLREGSSEGSSVFSSILGMLGGGRKKPDIGLSPIYQDDSSTFTTNLKVEEGRGFLDAPSPIELPVSKPSKQKGFVARTATLSELEGIPYESLLKTLEDNVGAGYVPKQPNGQPFKNSGVTVGMGVDLGQQNEQTLRKYGVPTNLINTFKPFFGKKGMDAQRALDKNDLVIDDLDDLRDLNNLVITGKMKEFEKQYPEFKNINDRDKGFMFAAHYHGSLNRYKKFRTRYLETQSIPTALETGLFNLKNKDGKPTISKDGVDRNRVDKALKWWHSQQEIPEVPISRPE